MMLPLFPRHHPAELAATGPAWDGGTLRGHPLGRYVVDADVWRDGNGWRWSAALRLVDDSGHVSTERRRGESCMMSEADARESVARIIRAWERLT